MPFPPLPTFKSPSFPKLPTIPKKTTTSTSTPKDNRSFLSRAYDTVFSPPERVSNFYDRTRARTKNPFLRGGLHVAEAFSTPGDLALTLGTGGLGLAARAGLKAFSKAPGLIKAAHKGVAGATAARGGERIITEEGGLNKGVGAAQLGLGLLGVRGGLGRRANKPRPAETSKVVELFPELPDIKADPRLPSHYLPKKRFTKKSLIKALDASKTIQEGQSALWSRELGKKVAKSKIAGERYLW